MESNYVKQEGYDKRYQSEEYRSLHYYSKKAMKKAYPKGGYILIGGIGEGLKETAGTFYYRQEEHDYYTLHYSKLRYGISGYICCGDDIYLALVRSKLRRNLLWLFAILSLLAGITYGILQFMDSKLDPNAKDFTPTSDIDIKTDPDHIALPGYGDIKVKAGSDTAYLALWNPPSNPCYFKFTILMGKEEVFQSGLVAPGKAVTEVKFSKKIEKGEHDIEIQIDTFSLEDSDIKMNSGVVETKVIGIETD